MVFLTFFSKVHSLLQFLTKIYLKRALFSKIGAHFPILNLLVLWYFTLKFSHKSRQTIGQKQFSSTLEEIRPILRIIIYLHPEGVALCVCSFVKKIALPIMWSQRDPATICCQQTKFNTPICCLKSMEKIDNGMGSK